MSEQTILLLDAGNTNVKFGLCRREGPIASYALPTEQMGTYDAMGLRIVDMCRVEGIDPKSIQAWAVSSVVPRLNPLMREAARRYCACDVFFAPETLPMPLENRYSRPAEVGADRLVTAYAATALFDAPAHIVIDFGTATTFDCVADGAYLGGLICPGILSSAAALAGKTAKLPQATLEVDSDQVSFGVSTSQSLNNGLVFGFASMVEGLCGRLKKQLPQGAMITSTGGFGAKLSKVTDIFDNIRPDLLLEGLRMAYFRKH